MHAQASVEGQRIFGLDVMRAAAILLVVAVHAGVLLNVHWPAHSALPGIDGVDVFFVLSGYLIGGILLRLQKEYSHPWLLRLKHFWLRRWLRTLPNYYLFLLLNIALLYVGLAPGLLNENALAYFAFAQNLIVPLDLFFWESWSLAVEEWFYFLFPLLLAAFSVLFRNSPQRSFLIAVTLFLLPPLVWRIHVSQNILDVQMADVFVRKMVFTRLDTIGFGLLGAWVQHMWPLAWERWRIVTAVLGTIILFLCIQLFATAELPWSMVVQLSLLPMGLALWLPLLSTWRSTPSWGAAVVFISKVSYAWYLVHMPFLYLWEGLLVERSALVTLLLYLAFWLVGPLFSAAVYRFWEKPWMDLRERWVPR